MGYSWSIHGIYVCIGYVSGMCRNVLGESRFVDNLVENNDDHYNKEEFFC